MMRRNERNLDNIPVGALGIIALDGCQEMGNRVDEYLAKWRHEDGSEYKDNIAFSGYERDSYLLSAKVPRFGSGEAKGIINESVRGKDIYILVDVCNYSCTYSMSGHVNHMSPDDHYQNLKRVSGLCTGTAGVGTHGRRQDHYIRCARSACTECNPAQRIRDGTSDLSVCKRTSGNS